MPTPIIHETESNVNTTPVRFLAYDEFEDVELRVKTAAVQDARQFDALDGCMSIDDLAVIAVATALHIVEGDYATLNAVQRTKLFWTYVSRLTAEKQRELR